VEECNKTKNDLRRLISEVERNVYDHLRVVAKSFS
jgi:hypothetical protein